MKTPVVYNEDDVNREARKGTPKGTVMANGNIERFIKLVSQPNITVEQYMFGWAKSYAIIVTQNNRPFEVIEFDNLNSIKILACYESRVEAHKTASLRWLAQFEGK